jgi:hypothetical protein
MADINSLIDHELRSYLSAVDEYQICVIELASRCKSGCFDIARARKAMSCQGSTVSQLQFPAQFVAQTKVEVDFDSDCAMTLKRLDRLKSNLGDADCCSPRPTDPLNWFGILIPDHLRKSQQSFTRGLEVELI